MIAGFIEPTGGTVRFGDRDVTHAPPNKRNTGMVFQSYALWPHMTVAQNVAYGLVLRRLPPDVRDSRVQQALEMVQMDLYAGRKPNELSGGQQQRVALARALVVEPDVLLLDEPLSNLDAKLRLEMRTEIRRICKESGITTIYVTHDQDEALSMADRVAVLKLGKAVQVGAPRDLYRQPATRFVAEFLGETNFIPAEVSGQTERGVSLDTPIGPILACSGSSGVPHQGNVTCSIRPEALHQASGPGTENTFTGQVEQQIFLGDQAQYLVRVGEDTVLRALQLNPSHEHPGEEMALHVDPSDVVILQDDGQDDGYAQNNKIAAIESKSTHV
jgi:iron(III) transport system ATP-binding protein